VPDEIAPDPEDAIPSPEEYAEACAAAATQGDCEAIAMVEDEWEVATMWCSWVQWVPTTLGAGDVCEYGTPTFACAMNLAGEEGCVDVLETCDTAGVLDGADGVLLSRDTGCLTGLHADDFCEFNTQGDVTGGPSECACLCDAAFPG
jgi:hypothetical protein